MGSDANTEGTETAMTTTTLDQTVGTRIREVREARGWSQAELAAAAQVSENTVLAAEQGRRKTQPAKLRAILDALDMESPSDTTLDLTAVPDDARIFLRVVAARLSALEEGPRLRLINELYPKFVSGD